MEKLKSASAKAEEAIRAELNPEQLSRLRSLQYQPMGAQTLYAEDPQKTLDAHSPLGDPFSDLGFIKG
ncbi:hypothetical protein EON82_19790 [bacterium]|nr:MAG: hypothetical protein EON82_19790 [bacterium]